MAWYARHYDGGWEHAYGVSISTLDNPGWRLEIDLTDTGLEKAVFDTVAHTMEADVGWWHCKVEEKQFRAACGPQDLHAILGIFRSWAMANLH
jgi:hypothetical protein